MNGSRPEYDVRLRARAGTAAIFRGAVALYIFYLGYTVLQGTLDGSSAVPVWAGWLAGIGFMTAALGFGVYTLKRYRIDLKAAELPAEQTQEEEP